MRYFSFSLVLAGIIAATGCTKHPATGVSVQSAFRPLIPPDTKVLAGLDVDKIKATPLYQRHEKDLDFPLLNGSSERIGLDPRKDISNVLVAWNGKQPIFMMLGRFKPAEVEKKIGSLGARRSTYQKYILLGDPKNSIVFLTKAVAIAGSAESLHGVIDLESKGDGEVPEELQERLVGLPKTNQIWAVSRGGLPFMEVPMRSDFGSALSNIAGYIQATSTGIGVDSGLHLLMNIVCVSTQGAQRVHDALRGGIGFARLSTKDNQQDLLRLYDAIQVEQDQQVVHVRVDLGTDLSDKVLSYLPQLQRSAGSAFRPQ